jgi:tetratricopeptide (TPR) repeat protein
MAFRSSPWIRAVVLVLASSIFLAADNYPRVSIPTADQLNPGWASYLEGLSKTESGKLDEAEQLFRKTLKENPKHAGALLGMGEVFLRRSNRKQAAVYFGQAVAAAPRNPDVLTATARFRAIEGDYAGAEKYYLQAVAADPKAAAAYLDLGDLYMIRHRKLDEALKNYRQVLSFQPDNPAAHYRAGLALSGMKQFDAAVAELRKASDYDKSTPLPYQALGRLYLARGSYDQAAEEFAKAQRARPAYVGAYLGRGDALSLKGDRAGALAEYQKAVGVAPTYAPSYLKLGVSYHEANKKDDAWKAYLKAIELDPKQADAYNNLACLAVEQRRDLDKAVEWAQKAVRLRPENPFVRDTLGWAYRAKGQNRLAAPIYTEIMAKKVKSGEVLYHAGVVFQEIGNSQKAKAALQEAIRMQADFPGADDARRRLAQLGAH